MARPQDTALARFYGLPKVHRDGAPLRPIVSLKGPGDRTIELLLQSKYDETENRLGRAQILQLLKLCLKTYFTFDGTIYEQVKGKPMGTPISGFIDEAVLQRLGVTGLPTPQTEVLGQVLTFQEHLNAIFPDVQFTMEEEENNQLAFLDVLDMASESYIKLVDQLLASEMPSTPAAAVSDQAPTSEIDLHIDTTGVLRLTLKRPTKKNAITWSMYETWTSMLNKAAGDTNVKMVVITGTGDYFCSGNDLSNFSEASKPGADLQKMVDAGKQVMQKFIASFIDFPKPLIGLINGPAVGVAVTTLPLYDCVMASDAATFHVPLTALGMTPEGCASYTFPRTMGSMKASNVLLFGRKLSAFEALSAGLITDVYPSQSFEEESRARIEQMAALPTQTLLYAKALLRTPASKAAMHATNLVESDRLGERWTSPDCIRALTAFLTRRG
ncbi:Enoyl-CoA delta isomerase 2, mitochondrial [Sparganum proliferum]